MAMIWYAGTPSDFGADDVTVYGTSNLVQFTSVTLDIYLERSTGSTQLDSTSMTDASGTGIDQVSATTAEVIWFKCDDTVTGDRDVFGTPDSGTTWYKFAPDNDSLVDRVDALEALELDGLSDVDTSGVSDGEVLGYTSSTQTWEPKASVAGSVSSLSDTTITAAADGDGLVHNGTAWVDSPVWRRWSGTQAQYDALGSYDDNTLYAVTG